MTVAAVEIWGQRVGAISQDEASAYAVFEYTQDCVDRGVELSPLYMPLRAGTYTFRTLAFDTFRGLPGMLADSLPDAFGNAVIDAWLADQGRAPETFSAVERLCYIGKRGMGALEFVPVSGPRTDKAEELDVSALVDLATKVLAEREGLHTPLTEPGGAEGIREILLVGSSAGGRRAKAIIAFNPLSGAVRSGQVDAPAGFEHWILKFDGVDTHGDVGNTQEFGAIEYAYAQMAGAAGVNMMECQLLEEGGRRHFMTRRFDRDGNDKLHMQSLAALAHLDFNQAGAHSYEQALQIIRRLGLSHAAIEQQFRRMVFNIVARNQDDHVKNIAFLMAPSGDWALAPAFDMTPAYNPAGIWTRRHQMSVNGKLDNFTVTDLRECGEKASMKRGSAAQILTDVVKAVERWREFAADVGISERAAEAIAETHRLRLPAN